MKVSVILPAAGLGTRMGRPSAEKTGTSRKQFMLLDGSPILVHTVRKFAACTRVTEIVVAVRREDLDWVGELLQGEIRQKQVRVVEGGNSRQESVANALATLGYDTDLVAVHDAVRPFVDLDTIEKALDEAAMAGAAIVGIVPVDTVKQVTRAQTEHVRIRGTIPRDKLVLAQTPQVFRYDLLKRAFEAAAADGFTGTDESSLVERLEHEVAVVLGSDRNIKITKPTDMDLARLFLEQETARNELA
jgi:2-C-methyl-D-erythritol 4-phosphate cytidylyltransferase